MIILYSRTDTEAELKLVQSKAKENGAFDAVVGNHWAEGGAGAVKLADAVIAACEQKSNFKFLYELDKTLEEKIKIITTLVGTQKNIELF